MKNSTTKKPSPTLILASASPRRSELMKELGAPFIVIPPGIDERPWPNEAPASYALRNASEKARWVLEKHLATAGVNGATCTIVAADTIVVLENRILEKPNDAVHAAEMLRLLSGKWHDVMTGLCVLRWHDSTLHEDGRVVRTAVRMKALSESDVAAYIATGEPMDKAGAYAIQGAAGAMIEETRGSFTNVVGLPMEELKKLLPHLEG
jgi:septum formation protein